MNTSESHSMEQLLLKRGWEQACVAEDADLIIINTCSVRTTAENRVLGRLGHYSALKKQKHFVVLLIGCMAERLYEEIQKTHPLIDYVVGMFERHLLPQLFDEIKNDLEARTYENKFARVDRREWKIRAEQTNQKMDGRESTNQKTIKKAYTFAPFSYSEGAFQSFVPIMNGCNNFCTYCIVPYVRGREVSRSPEDILNEISLLSEKGVKEITLLGQNVNSYRGITKEGKEIDFPNLLHLIDMEARKQETIKWIRFISSHPKDLSDTLIDAISSIDRICKSLHLPVQHGSNNILKRMNRRYTVEHYLSRIDSLRKKIPNIALTSDILIGFPGETENDVELTLNLMKNVQFDNAFMYHYNPREGTVAFNFQDRINEKVKIERLGRIIDLQLAITKEKMLRQVGKTVTLLLESASRNDEQELFGHTEANEMAVVEGGVSPSLIGQFVKVQIKELKGKTFRCIIV